MLNLLKPSYFSQHFKKKYNNNLKSFTGDLTKYLNIFLYEMLKDPASFEILLEIADKFINLEKREFVVSNIIISFQNEMFKEESYSSIILVKILKLFPDWIKKDPGLSLYLWANILNLNNINRQLDCLSAFMANFPETLHNKKIKEDL